MAYKTVWTIGICRACTQTRIDIALAFFVGHSFTDGFTHTVIANTADRTVDIDVAFWPALSILTYEIIGTIGVGRTAAGTGVDETVTFIIRPMFKTRGHRTVNPFLGRCADLVTTCLWREQVIAFWFAFYRFFAKVFVRSARTECAGWTRYALRLAVYALHYRAGRTNLWITYPGGINDDNAVWFRR